MPEDKKIPMLPDLPPLTGEVEEALPELPTLPDLPEEDEPSVMSDMWDSFKSSLWRTGGGLMQGLTDMAISNAKADAYKFGVTLPEDVSMSEQFRGMVTNKFLEKGEEIASGMKQFDKGIWDSIVAGDYGDAGRQLATGFTGTIPTMAAIAANPYVGITALGVSAKGEKKAEMMKEIEEGKAEYTPLQIALTSTGYGGAEVVGDVLFRGALKSTGKIFKQAYNKGGKEALEQAAEGFWKEAFKGTVYEAGGEGLTQFMQNASDKYITDKDVDLFQGVPDAIIMGAVTTGGLSTGGYVGGKILSSFAEPNQKKTVAANSEKIASLEQTKANITEEQQKAITEMQGDLIKENASTMEETAEIAISMTPEQRKDVFNNSQKVNEIDDILSNPNLDEASKSTLLAERSKYESDRQAIISESKQVLAEQAEKVLPKIKPEEAEISLEEQQKRTDFLKEQGVDVKDLTIDEINKQYTELTKEEPVAVPEAKVEEVKVEEEVKVPEETFDTIEQAAARAEELGIEGTHEVEGKFMPGKTHEEFVELTKTEDYASKIDEVRKEGEVPTEVKVEEGEPVRGVREVDRAEATQKEIAESVKNYTLAEAPTKTESRQFGKDVRSLSENVYEQEGLVGTELKTKVRQTLEEQGIKITDDIGKKIDKQVEKVSGKYEVDVKHEAATTELDNISDLPAKQQQKALVYFAEANKDILKGISMSKIKGKAKLKGKTLEAEVARIKERLGEKLGKTIVKKRKDIEDSIKKIKTKETKQAATKYSQMTPEEVNIEVETLTNKRNLLNDEYNSTNDTETLNEIIKLEEEIALAETLGGLDEKNFAQLSKTEKDLKQIDEARSKKVREYLKKDKDRIDEQAGKFRTAVEGKFDLEKSRVEEKQKRSLISATNNFVSGAVNALIKPIKGFLNYQNALKYLFKRMDKTWELGRVAGKKAWDARNYIGRNLEKALRTGESKRTEIRTVLNDKFNQAIEETFGSLRKASKVSKKVINVPFTRVSKDAEGNVIEDQVERKVTMETAAHLYYSSQSEANSEYMNRLGLGNEKLQFNDDTFAFLENELSKDENKGMLELTEKVAEEILPALYPELNKTYKDLTGMNLEKLDGYLPVNGIGIGQERFDLSKIDLVKVYQSMVKNRRGGRYDLERNGIISGTYTYINNASTFAGLAKPVSDVVRVLTNKKVSEMTKAREMDGTRKAILDILSEAMAPTQVSGFGVKMYRNFIVSKVALHMGLIPKQLVSTLAVFDPDYVAPKHLFSAIGKGMINKDYRKLVNNILEESYDFKTRSLSEIESLFKANNKKGWDLNSAKAMKDLIDKSTGKMSEANKKTAVTMLEYVYMPTKFGDRFAIKFAGKPLILASYLENKALLEKDGITGIEADKMARRHALSTFEEWMNNTQQSSKFTDKSLFQTGFWRFAMPFLNSPRLYADKIMDSYADVYRNYRANIDYSETSAGKRYLKPLASLNKSKSAQKIILYQMALPIIFSQMGRGFKDLSGIFSDDEEEREKSWIQLKFEGGLAWTKGLFLLGTFVDYANTLATKGRVSERADNIVSISDDVFQMINVVNDLIEGKDVEGLNESERDKLQDKYRKTVAEAIQKGLNIVGLPGETIRRYKAGMKEFEKDEVTERMMRTLGFSKDQLNAMFGEKKKERPLLY
jgi:hypothetical protein